MLQHWLVLALTINRKFELINTTFRPWQTDHNFISGQLKSCNLTLDVCIFIYVFIYLEGASSCFVFFYLSLNSTISLSAVTVLSADWRKCIKNKPTWRLKGLLKHGM